MNAERAVVGAHGDIYHSEIAALVLLAGRLLEAGPDGLRPRRTWEVTCTVCGEKRWPYAIAEPKDHVCLRCRVVSPEKRAAARAL